MELTNFNSGSDSSSSPTHKTTLLSIIFNKETKRPIISFLLILPLSFVLLQQLTPLQPLSFFLLTFSTNENESENENGTRCDYTKGKWVRNERVSYYTEECPFLDPGFQCVHNGRNDTGYMYWRWQPHGCDLPMYVQYYSFSFNISTCTILLSNHCFQLGLFVVILSFFLLYFFFSWIRIKVINLIVLWK